MTIGDRCNTGSVLAVAALMLVASSGCKNSVDDIFDDFESSLKEGYAFEDDCNPESDGDACQACCEGLGYSDSATFNEDECGCTSTESDDQVCASSADFDACSSCCEGEGYTSSLSLGDSCTCSRNVDEPVSQP